MRTLLVAAVAVALVAPVAVQGALVPTGTVDGPEAPGRDRTVDPQLPRLAVRPGTPAGGLAPSTLLGGTGPLPMDEDETLPGIAEPCDDPATCGRWDPALIEGEEPAVNMVLLHDGRVLYWSGVEAVEHDHGDHNHPEDPHDTDDNLFFFGHPHIGDSRVLDLSGSTPAVVTPANSTGGRYDLFCSGQTVLPDGRVLTVGGTNWTTLEETTAQGAPDTNVLYGTREARVFDPATTEWRSVEEMSVGRWYPSALTLPSGDAMVASGIGNLSDFRSHQTLTERYAAGDGDAADGGWSDAGDSLLPLYPRLDVVPSGPMKGDVHYSTVGTLWGTFGEHPMEGVWNLQHRYDPETATWSRDGPSIFGVRQHGVSVMLPLSPDDGHAAEVLTFGGTLQRSVGATALAEIADLSGASPDNRIADPLSHPRWHANGVLLPDGQVLAVGGGLYDNVVVHGQPNVPLMNPELYDPAADEWRLLAPMQVPRMYHSTAVLLPDGRVLVGGHVPLPVPWKDVRDNVPFQGQPVETRLEVFEPPYLHRGDRPDIATAPAAVGYNVTFTATVHLANGTGGLDDAEALFDGVVLMRPGATTHAYDSGQRAVRVEIVDASVLGPGGPGQPAEVVLTLKAPPDAAVAPPGWYMLFVNGATDDGPVPSEAAWVRVGQAA